MSLKTRYNLWKIQRSLSPDRLFKAELLKKLNVIWDNNYNVKYAWYQTGWFKHAAGFVSVVLMAGSLGTGAYAYTSPTITEGSVLYPIKNKLENIEEKIQITPEAKAKFYLKKIDRREAEREVLKKKILLPEIKKEINETKKDVKLEAKEKIKTEVAERKIQKTEKSIERAEEQLEQTDKIIEKIEFKDVKLRKKVKERLKARLEKREERLEIKSEQQKERRENLKEVRQNKNNKIEKRSRTRKEREI